MDGSGVILRDDAVVDNSVARQGNDDPDLLVASKNTGSSGQDYRCLLYTSDAADE